MCPAPLHSLPRPHLERCEYDGITYYSDPALTKCGVVLGFTERGGGVSEPPYESLNLGTHVGDDPAAVAENRHRVIASLLATVANTTVDAETLFARLRVPNQTHGERIAVVERETSSRDLLETDALITATPNKPIMLCFADCVPVILVAPGPAVAVAHAGWKGALASLPGKTATALANHAGCDPSEVNAYIGAHIRDCCYESSEEVVSEFVQKFGEKCRTGERNLSLSHAVRASLTSAGIDPTRIAELPYCTACSTDRFFSYRAEGSVTGRHAAVVFLPNRL